MSRFIPEFTTLIAVDTEHLEELKTSAPTWRKHRPEIWQNPMLAIFDSNWGLGADYEFDNSLDFLEHPNLQVVPDIDCLPWTRRPKLEPAVSQREKMLTALVFASYEIHTEWYLKLDCDTLAFPSPSGRWIEPHWFDSVNASRASVEKCAFIAGAWGYSKPADVIQRLDSWGDTIPGIREHPRLDIPFDPSAKLVSHPRIISYVMFGNTAWTRRMADLAGSRLPVPSQDTFLFYCAERRGNSYRREQWKNYGWRHVGSGRLEKLKAAADEALAAPAILPTAQMRQMQQPRGADSDHSQVQGTAHEHGGYQ